MPFAGEVLRVKMLVKEATALDQNNPLYTVAAVEIEKPVSTRGESASEEGRSPAPPTGFEHRFVQLAAAVNGEGVSKVVDENGKPLVVAWRWAGGRGMDFLCLGATVNRAITYDS